MVPKNFSASSLAMQRASIEAAAALMSSGNSRNTKRTLPVSIYFDFSIGKTFCSNAAQCGQVIDAYSVMVTAAFADPTAISGNDAGFATNSAVEPCALASPIRGNGAKPARAANPSDKAAAQARRVKINGLLRKWRFAAGSGTSRSLAGNDHSGNGGRRPAGPTRRARDGAGSTTATRGRGG